MTSSEQKEIIEQIVSLLTMLIGGNIESEKIDKARTDKPIEMLTIKECAEIINGLSEHSIRKMILDGRLKSVRVGEGKRGKILVNKENLLEIINK